MMIPNAVQITHRIRGHNILISMTVDIRRPISVSHPFTRLLLAEISIANVHIEPTNDKKPPATILFISLASKSRFTGLFASYYHKTEDKTRTSRQSEPPECPLFLQRRPASGFGNECRAIGAGADMRSQRRAEDGEHALVHRMSCGGELPDERIAVIPIVCIQWDDGKMGIEIQFLDLPGDGVDGAVAADGLAADLNLTGCLRGKAHDGFELSQRASSFGVKSAAESVMMRIFKKSFHMQMR